MKIKFGNWTLGWSRNVAIGVVWTKHGEIAIFFLGLVLGRYLQFDDE